MLLLRTTNHPVHNHRPCPSGNHRWPFPNQQPRPSAAQPAPVPKDRTNHPTAQICLADAPIRTTPPAHRKIASTGSPPVRRSPLLAHAHDASTKPWLPAAMTTAASQRGRAASSRATIDLLPVPNARAPTAATIGLRPAPNATARRTLLGARLCDRCDQIHGPLARPTVPQPFAGAGPCLHQPKPSSSFPTAVTGGEPAGLPSEAPSLFLHGRQSTGMLCTNVKASPPTVPSVSPPCRHPPPAGEATPPTLWSPSTPNAVTGEIPSDPPRRGPGPLSWVFRTIVKAPGCFART